MVVRWALYVLLAIAALGSGIWSTLALWYQLPGGTAVRGMASIVWAVFVLGLAKVGWSHHRYLFIGLYMLGLAIMLMWSRSITPSNHRDWADDVSRSMTGSIQGSQVTLYNVRDFTWRTDKDYDVHWETRHYDLDHLSSADLVLSSWGMPGIVHALVSFGFDNGSHVVFSVEVRRQRNQSFSSIGGFFKYFERAIVAADERDVIRVRTNVRDEVDHLYRLRMSKPAMRALFLSYVREANELAIKPAFYNTVTSNCVTIVFGMAKQINPKLPYDYRLLLTAYLPSYLYEAGALDKRYPLDVLTRQGNITARARATGPGDDFSRAIRTPPEPGG